jgi:hypothetical protein
MSGGETDLSQGSGMLLQSIPSSFETISDKLMQTSLWFKTIAPQAAQERFLYGLCDTKGTGKNRSCVLGFPHALTGTGFASKSGILAFSLP